MAELNAFSGNVRSVVSMNTYNFRWSVENISKFSFDTDLKSPAFHLYLSHTFYATFKIYKNYDCSFTLHKSSGSSIEIKHNVSFENCEGLVLQERISTHRYGDPHPLYYSFITRSEVQSKIKEIRDAVKNNAIIIKCVMEFATTETDSDIYKFRPRPVSSLDDISALSNDMKVMHSAPMYADVSLKLGENTVHVHKSVMCARSSVMARMFKTPMGESEKNIIDITDLNLSVLKDLVSYLYTGVLENDDFESVYALYYAADKYDVPSLQKTCSDVLLSRLDIENACRLLALADRHSDSNFKDQVMDFIKFYLHDTLKTRGWKELVEKATPLAAEVMSLRGKKKRETKDISEFPSNGINARTAFSENNYTFCWAVKNFSNLPTYTEMKSLTFQPLPKHTFHAVLELTGSFDCVFKFYKCSGSDIEVKHKVSIEDCDGLVFFNSNVSTHKYEATASEWDVFKSNVSSVIEKVRNTVKDDVLIFKCVMEFGTIKVECDHYELRPRAVSPLQDMLALSNDLEVMYSTSLYADVGLKVGEDVIYAHKSVMCARSSVLASMFGSPEGVSKKNEVVITDLTLPVLQDLVSYMYTGMLAKDDFESVYALYGAADKYDVSSLNKKCADVLLSRLDIDNACRVLDLADRHSDDDFKDSAMNFVNLCFDKVLETEAWDEIVKNSTRLAAEVIAL